MFNNFKFYENNYLIFDFNKDGKKDLFGWLYNAGEGGTQGNKLNPQGKILLVEDYLNPNAEKQYLDSEIIYGGLMDLNDFNNDGYLDVLITGNNSHEVDQFGEQFPNVPFEIFYFSSDGFRREKLDFIADSVGPITGDVDNDGDIDIIETKDKTNEEERSYLLRNDGKGNFFIDNNFYSEGLDGLESLEKSEGVLFDLNNDGCLDWVTNLSNQGYFVEEDGVLFEYPFEILQTGPGRYDDPVYVEGEYVKSGLRILWGNCSGNFDIRNSSHIDTQQPYLRDQLGGDLESSLGSKNYAFMDYNSDGFTDILLVKEYQNQKFKGIQIFKGSSDSSYLDVTEEILDQYFFTNDINKSGMDSQVLFYEFAIKDIENDGDLDFFPWGLNGFMDECWNDYLSGKEYWENIDGKFFYRGDSDLDGVVDSKDLCGNTPRGTVVDTEGSELNSLPNNVFLVSAINNTCIDSDNGSIRLSSTDTNYNYLYSIDGTDPTPVEGEVSITGLGIGSYNVCFTVDGVSDYERCYTVSVGEPDPLEVSSVVNFIDRSLDLNLSGSKSYQVLLNGKTLTTDESRISLSLQSGKNTIEIKGEQDCQGIYFEEIFVSEEVKVYPNPTNGPLQLYVSGMDSSVEVSITSINGAVVQTTNRNVPMNRVLDLDLTNLNSGTYIVSIKGSTVQVHQKVIKR